MSDQLSPPRQGTFKRNAHINYFLRCLRALPSAAQGHDSNRITIAYFCISGLDLLGALEEKTSQEQRNGWIQWIWSLQAPSGGFRGSTYMTTDNPETSPGHLPSTYTALLTLALLRAPLDRLDLISLARFLRSCQGSDGSSSPLTPTQATNPSASFQSDLRMVYIASVICDIVQDFSYINVHQAVDFIERCRTWEGGYASRPGVIEAQGGTTYCAIAALSILSSNTTKPSSLSPSSSSNAPYSQTLRWLIHRQIGGFQGRPGKLEDVCYSFWCGAGISILGKSDFINVQADKSFLLSSQHIIGGFGKEPEDFPDPFHSYLAIAALSLSHSTTTTGDPTASAAESRVSGTELGLKVLDAKWNVGVDTVSWLTDEMTRIRGLSAKS